MPILKSNASELTPILNGGYTMTYYTNEQLLKLIIADVIYWMSDEGTPYTPTYPEILPYINSALLPYWLEEKCVLELNLLIEFMGEPSRPNFITNYNSMMSIQVYTGMFEYYNGL